MTSEDWKSDLNPFFNPRSIAIIGASEAKGSFTDATYQYLIQFGFKGNIYPVNPKREKVWDLPCSKTVKEIDGPVDLVVIGVAAPMVHAILTECGEKGVRSAVIFSSGFSEIGNEEGIRLQKELAAIAEKYKIRTCGPNCIGFLSTQTNTVCYAAPLPPTIPKGRVGYVSQSATMATNVVSAGVNNGIGFSYAVSSGNEAVLEFSDYVRFMLKDPEIDLVAGFVEGVKDSRKFLEVADLAIRLGKPLLILKIGRSELAKEAAASHTGSMTGSYAVYQTVFKQKGITSIDSVEQMVESIKLFSYRKPIKKGGLSIISGSGGACGFLADKCDEVGLSIPQFSKPTKARLREVLPSFGTVHNPLDFTGQARTNLEMVSNLCRAILQDDEIEVLIMASGSTRSIVTPFILPVNIKYVEAGREYPDKLLAFLSCNTENLTQEMNEFVDTYKVPILQGGSVGLKAIKSLLDFNRFLISQEESREEAVPVVSSSVIQKWQNLLSQRSTPLPEKVAKDLLKDYGIRVPKGMVVFSIDEAKGAASSIGYPVVLKIHSSKITHKTESGAVKLSLSDEAGLVNAFSELKKLAKDLGTDEGFLLEEMIVGPGTEMILGIQKDPTFGPVIMLGLGGIFTELFQDVSFRLAPVGPLQARTMIQEIRGAKLLSGFRGKPKCDVDALVNALSRIGRLAQDLSGVISQVDINPLVVLEEGKGVVALDALVVT